MSSNAETPEILRLSRELETFGTATIFAAHADVRVLPGRIRRVSGTRCAGPSRTALMRAGDNYALHQAIATAKAGEVIVGVVEGSVPGGYFGEIMAHACQAKGIAGVVLDATVRDVDDLASMNFAVFATGTDVADTTKRPDTEHGSGFDIRVEDVIIHEGDWLLADGTAVVHIPAHLLGNVLEVAARRNQQEAAMRRAVSQGVSTLELISRNIR